MEIGQILKEEREAKNLTLDDIQDMTKIQKRYLQAIEDNEFHRLPGRFYARAFIKEYALVLGLDPNTLLSYFDAENVQQEETVQYANVRRSRRATAAKSKSILSFLPTVIVIVLIISVLFIAWTLTQKALTIDGDKVAQDNESDQIIRDVDEPERETPIAEEEEEAENSDDSLTPQEPAFESEFNVLNVGEGTSPESELEFLHAEDEVVLSFDVSADAYISIVGSSGTRYFDGILSPNAEIGTYDISDEENVYLNVGNTAGLTIKMNDVEMEYPVNPQDRVHQKFLIHLKKQEE